MTPKEVEILLARNEEIRKAREAKSDKHNPSTDVPCSFTVDQTLYTAFKEKAKEDGLTVSAILRGAAISYTFGRLKFSGDRLLSTEEAILNTPGGQRAANYVPRETQPAKRGAPFKEKPPEPVWVRPTEISAIGSRDPQGNIINWIDLDHTDRPLRGFDYPDNIHPDADGRTLLEMDWSRDDSSGSLENTLLEEYVRERYKFDEREWRSEYWNFCRCCAKKFLTLNKATNLRYDQDYLSNHLTRIFDIGEQVFASYEEGRIKYENSK